MENTQFTESKKYAVREELQVFLFLYMNKVMIYMPDFSKTRLNSSIILFYPNSISF